MSQESPINETADKENQNSFITHRVGSVKISRGEKLNLENGYNSIVECLKELREKDITAAHVPEVADVLKDNLKKCNQLSKVAYESACVKCISFDSNYFANCSALNCNVVKATDVDYEKFDCSSFAEKLITKLNAGGRVDAIFNGSQARATVNLSDFESLSSKYSNLINDVPSFQFMFGAFDSEEMKKEIKERKVRTLKTDVPAKKPETVDAKDVTKNADLTAKSVDLLFNDLKKRSKGSTLPYSTFVSDQSSFSKTVENIFHSAFLVKEGFVELSKNDSDEQPTIRCTKKEERENRDVNAQAVLSFSMDDWKKWIANMEDSDSSDSSD